MTAGGTTGGGVTTRCLIADDQAMVREGFAALLAFLERRGFASPERS